MHFTVVLLLSLLLAGFDHVQPACADFSQSYVYYLKQAEDALGHRDYEGALNYFKHAHLIEPSASYPVEKIRQLEDYLTDPEPNTDRLVSSESAQRYEQSLDSGKKAAAGGHYEEAVEHFQAASQADPESKEVVNYIDLAKRAQDRRVEKIDGKVYETEPVIVYAGPSKSAGRDKLIGDELERVERSLSSPEKPKPQNPPAEAPPVEHAKITGVRPAQTFSGTKTVVMDDLLWATQPKTDLRLELNTMLILESKNIERFLVITPGFIEVERVDRDHIKITPLKIGVTYLHVWDDRGRWTFHVQTILPVDTATANVRVKRAEEEYAEPFQFSYDVEGGTLYRGSDLPSAKRESLNLTQSLGVYGQTPYGAADASVGLNKFNDTTQATSYTVGLSGARGAGFTDVNIRGFDASKYFTALVFPGQYFRGIAVEGKTIGEKLGAAYIHGQDRYTYSFVSPGIVDDRESFVEGARLTAFPSEENQVSFNYAHGYGEARQSFLRDEAYSVDGRYRLNKTLMTGEVATNSDNRSEVFTARYGEGHHRLRASFRDIDEDYTTATNIPSNQGEIGTLLGGTWAYDSFEVNSNADIYQERLLSNRDNPNALNYDLDTSVRVPLNDVTTWTTSGYYVDTPGELSARRNVRLMSDINRRYKIFGDRDLQLYAGPTFQRSRVSETVVSDYDRYSVTTGLRLGLVRNLSYFANYEYSWVDNLSSDDWSNPNVFNTGLNYSKEFTGRISTNIGFYYRNEENTLGTNSFLAGEDSITGSVGMSYRPTDNAEIFWDSRVRNVWKENPDNPAYNEIDVRWGLRSTWDLPVSWNPKGMVRGRVYKDLNNNSKRDPGEPGMANVRVKVGKQEVVTDETGNYITDVSAKKVLVVPDLSTVAKGYVLTTPPLFEVRIPSQKSIDFGFTTESGIYGVVYVDKNGNKQPDEGDTFVQKVKIILDNKESAVTEYDGTYFFKDVSGGKHTVRIDINSLPIEYIPLVKVSNAVEVTEGTTYVYHIPVKTK